ncbi:MAG: hypothetical protein WBB70_08635, partial [Desulfobacterales bacterium]
TVWHHSFTSIILQHYRILDSSLFLMYLIELTQISEASNQVNEDPLFYMWESVERVDRSLNV